MVALSYWIYGTRNNNISSLQQCSALHNILSLYPFVPLKEKNMVVSTTEKMATSNIIDSYTLKWLSRMYEGSIPIKEICEQLGIEEKTVRALLKLLRYGFDE